MKIFFSHLDSQQEQRKINLRKKGYNGKMKIGLQYSEHKSNISNSTLSREGYSLYHYYYTLLPLYPIKQE